MTTYYGKATQSQIAFIENKINREINVCQTSLVDAMLSKEDSGFEWEDIENAYTEPVYDMLCPDCDKPVKENTLVGYSYEWRCTDEECDWYGDADEMNEEEESEPKEIYEWWECNTYLANSLREQGEAILDNEYGTWWGRCCTGQSIVLDPTFWDIFSEGVEIHA